MHLSRENLIHLSQGTFSAIPSWSSPDHDPNRLIIPAPPYLFIDQIDAMDEKRIRYTCFPDRNPLLRDAAHLPLGIIVEFFQGYMVLSDWMGLAKLPPNTTRRSHRAVGGTFHYHAPLPPPSHPITVEVEITKVSKLGKSTLLQYQAWLRDEEQLLVEVENFNGIFYVPQDKPNAGAPPQEEGKPSQIYTVAPAPYRLIQEATLYPEGVLLAHYQLDPQAWFFQCHFIGDPCIPGSLVLQSAFDMLDAYVGHAVTPIPHNTIHTVAKRNILPTDHEVTMRLVIQKETETEIIADYFVLVDGQMAFTCTNIGVKK